MTLELGDIDAAGRDAVRLFWTGRDGAKKGQKKRGAADIGGRSSVTAGKNMDGFVQLLADLLTENGLDTEDIHIGSKIVTLPGFFRPTKRWDMLVIHRGELVAVLELKSQVGPSFGNNFNNRAEEVLGSGVDLRTAFRGGAFGDQPKPFVGWLMLLEDCEASRKPIANDAPHFPVLEEFDGASYAERYRQLCRKLVAEELYDAAALLLTNRDAAKSGEFSELDDMTSLRTFAAEFAGHVASAAARLAD